MLGVVPILIGPLQVLLAILPGVIIAVLGIVVSVFKPRAIKAAAQVLWRLKLQALAAICCVLALRWVADAYWPDFGPSANTAEAGGDWPTFRGGLRRLGSVPGSSGPSGGSINWIHRTGGQAFYSSPAVVGNRVYAASATAKAFSAGSGRIYCFDADTGAVVWSSAPSGYRPTFSSPVISGHRLVCGEGLHLTPDARIICLDIRPEAAGKVLWTFQTSSHVECTPVIDDGRVFIGAGDDGYYCLALDSGKELWRKPGKQYPDAETSLAVCDGKVYAGLGLGGRALCVLDAETGAELDRIPTPQALFSPPTICDGKLYIAMGSGDYANSAEAVAGKEIDKRRTRLKSAGKTAGQIAAAVSEAEKELAPGGQVWRLDLRDLSVDWKFEVERTVLGSVAVVDDEVYFGSRDGRVYCLDRSSGEELARADLHSPIKASLAVSGDLAYAMSDTGVLVALTRGGLEPVWEIKLGSARTQGRIEAMCISSPAIARGKVYVGTQNEGFMCAGQPGRRKPPIWSGRLGGPGEGGNIDGSPLPLTGTLAWQWPYSDDDAGTSDEALVQAPPAVLEGRILVPFAIGAKRGVACLPVEGDPKAKWTVCLDLGVWTSPAAVGDRVFVVDGRPGCKGRALHCLGADDGRTVWKTPIADRASGVFQASDSFIVIQDRPGQLSWFSRSGMISQSVSIGSINHGPALTASMIVVAADDPAALIAMDGPTGVKLWRRKLPCRPTTSPVVSGTEILVGTHEALEVRKLIDGSLIRRTPLDVGGDIVLGRKYVVYPRRGEVVVVDRTDGSVIARHGNLFPGSSVLLGRRGVLFETSGDKSGDRKIVTLDLDAPKNKPRQWLEDSSWLGKPTGPMVSGGSKVYMGRSGWGLVCLTAEN